ncbi:DUF3267 domain-containing protein [Leptolyngbyaceae cyanobacterium CCMR0082]|uniref:DUF3267 domain-containing protein n=1 Tax=Adonisia turfae CCMR0082 TaxID=2304604 RepID=A0A6M0SJZ7_9CYAN|nr:DUF3267 domain-containing protein [Adonisia turfae]MDV3352023.1 DUF3267 domain-containing protein [Leptothoe sp. LEGE 181152]NEZ68233.1 DUF3267 domain-containing protein [Adonisia turfae CCMR0082]
MKKDISVSMSQGNNYAVIAALPPIIILSGIYIWIWGWQQFFIGISIFLRHPLLCLIGIVAGTILHESIHGLTWKFFGNKPSSAIKYGVKWKALAPYAHCKEPMDVRAYKLGVAMPGVLLGLVPAILGILTSNSLFLTFGLLFTMAAGGDIVILWLLREVETGMYVEDHPTRIGCYVISSNRQ